MLFELPVLITAAIAFFLFSAIKIIDQVETGDQAL